MRVITGKSERRSCAPAAGGGSVHNSQKSLPLKSAAPPCADLEALPIGRAGRLKIERHRLRAAAGALLGGRQRACGRTIIGGMVEVVDDGRADCGHHYSGLETCGSVWTCPVCAAKGRRAAQVTEATRQHLLAGGLVALVTLTVRHGLGDDLTGLRDLVRDTWSDLKSGRGWVELREPRRLPAVPEAATVAGQHPLTYRRPRRTKALVACEAALPVLRPAVYLGDVRALEVTWGGAHGWHPHLHVLLFFAPGAERPACEAWLGELEHRWRACVVRRLAKRGGLSQAAACELYDLLDHGQHWQMTAPGDWDAAERVAEYVAKVAADPEAGALGLAQATAAELTRHYSKTGRPDRHTLNQWQLLTLYREARDRERRLRKLPVGAPERAELPEISAAARQFGGLFKTFAATMAGSQQLRWSDGLKEHFGVVEMEDAEDGEDSAEGSGPRTLCHIARPVWRQVVGRECTGHLLAMADLDRLDGVCRLLDQLGVAYTVADDDDGVPVFRPVAEAAQPAEPAPRPTIRGRRGEVADAETGEILSDVAPLYDAVPAAEPGASWLARLPQISTADVLQRWGLG